MLCGTETSSKLSRQDFKQQPENLETGWLLHAGADSSLSIAPPSFSCDRRINRRKNKYLCRCSKQYIQIGNVNVKEDVPCSIDDVYAKNLEIRRKNFPSSSFSFS